MKIYAVLEYEPYESDIYHGYYVNKLSAEVRREEVFQTFSRWQKISCYVEVEEIEVHDD